MHRLEEVMTNLLANNDSARSAFRHAAAAMLVEATERGDLDMDTVQWAVDRLQSFALTPEPAPDRLVGSIEVGGLRLSVTDPSEGQWVQRDAPAPGAPDPAPVWVASHDQGKYQP